MNWNNLYEAMKLRKRFLLICAILSIVFLSQILYFYSHPSSESSALSEISQEVVKIPLKSNKTLVNARNLFQGIKLHQQNMKSKNEKLKKMVTILNSSFEDNELTTVKKRKRSSSEIASSEARLNFYNKNGEDNKWNFNEIKNNTTKDFNNLKYENSKSRNDRHRLKTKRHIPRITKHYNSTQISQKVFDNREDNQDTLSITMKRKNIKSNTSSKFVDNHLARNRTLKTADFRHHGAAKSRKDSSNVKLIPQNFRLDVDKEAFAADENFAEDNWNDLPLLKKQAESVNNLPLDDFLNEYHDSAKKSTSPDLDSWINSVRDYRIMGKVRNQMSREEILFGNLKPRNLSNLPDEVRIVSMSLYGSEKRYMVGAIKNAKLIKKNFPGWMLRFYVESPLTRKSRIGRIPNNILENLRNLGADVHYIIPEEDFLPPMMWRFLVADDPSVDRFIVRDSDSRLTKRDFASVEAWMQSGQPFHCIRDHPSHAGQSISGGLWGGESHKLRVILRSSWIEAMRGLSSGYFTDMSFLQGHVWPRVVSHAYCSDSVSCDRWPNSFPFPVRRYGFDHVGEVYNERDLGRPIDFKILQRVGENDWCKAPPDY